MLFLLLQLGDDRYALETGQIVEVLPLLSIKQIPQAPPAIAGVINYHGAPVPTIDLSQLVLGHPACKRLSTRIVVARCPDGAGKERLLGLLAERATQTMRRGPGDFASTGVRNDGAAYLGPVTSDEHGLIQWIDVHKLLPASMHDMLFKQPAEDGWFSANSKRC